MWLELTLALVTKIPSVLNMDPPSSEVEEEKDESLHSGRTEPSTQLTEVHTYEEEDGLRKRRADKRNPSGSAAVPKLMKPEVSDTPKHQGCIFFPEILKFLKQQFHDIKASPIFFSQKVKVSTLVESGFQKEQSFLTSGLGCHPSWETYTAKLKSFLSQSQSSPYQPPPPYE